MAGEVSFTPTQQDWVRANTLWYGHHRSRRWLKWLGFAGLGLSAITAVLDVAVLGKTVWQTVEDTGPILFFAAAVGCAPLLTRFSIPRNVRRQFEQRPAMSDPARYTWSDEEISGTTRTGTTNQPWRELHRQLRDQHSLIFLMTDQMMLLVPRRFLTPEQDRDLTATADRHGPSIG